jgi:hypothetical protein
MSGFAGRGRIAKHAALFKVNKKRMCEKDLKANPGKSVQSQTPPAEVTTSSSKAPKKSKEDRLAEALRANLRRRKSAAKTRKDS